MKLYGLFTCDTCGKQLGATCCTNQYQGQFCSVSCADKDALTRAATPTPPTPSQVLTGILETLKEELSKGSKDSKQLESLRASVRILEKQKLVLKHENSRLYAKVRDLDGLCAEQIEYIEELERKVIQEDDNPSYIAQLHKILDKKDEEIKGLRERHESTLSLKKEIEGLREENNNLKLANDGWMKAVNKLKRTARQ